MADIYLPVEQIVYVPSTNQQQNKVSPMEMQRRVAEVKRFLSQKYGGFTAVKGEGGYAMQNKGNKLVQENVVKVTSFSTKQKYKQNKLKLISQIRTWGKKWGQESMGLEVEGDLEYVDTSQHKHKTVPITLKEMKVHHSPSWIESETGVWG